MGNASRDDAIAIEKRWHAHLHGVGRSQIPPPTCYAPSLTGDDALSGWDSGGIFHARRFRTLRLLRGKPKTVGASGKRPRPSVRSSDTTGPSSVPCRARVGRCVPGPAHCVVASRRALGPHLVKSRMPKNSARATCQENHLFPPPIKTLGQRENVVPAGSSWFPRKFPRKVDLDPETSCKNSLTESRVRS